MTKLKELFLLDPEVAFLNHGSFGATPKPVFEVYQSWQRKLEHQPVEFLFRKYSEYLGEAREILARYLQARADEIAFVPNTTFGVNAVARSVKLEPGDEVLATNHEYWSCNNVWNFVCRKAGAKYTQRPIPLPTGSQEEIVETFWGGVTEKTRLIYLSHITSVTALRLPVEAICKQAREAGIPTFIDGAHAPGQIPLALEELGADFYTGNCHKWMCAPKGSAFLYARREKQALIEPLLVGWGWGEEPPRTTGSRYLDNFQWPGTFDPSAYLSVPAAIQFLKEHSWSEVVQDCHEMLVEGLARIHDLTGMGSLYPDSEGYYRQMASAPLPPVGDLTVFQARLYDEFQVEVPCHPWNEMQLIRVSVQGYNTAEDIERLLTALGKLI